MRALRAGQTGQRFWSMVWCVAGLAGLVLGAGPLHAQAPAVIEVPADLPLPAVPETQPEDRPLPINLPTALQLAGASPLDIALASQRVQVAAAQLDRANVLWLPSVYIGADYFRHDGQIQDVRGDVFTTSRSSLLLGAGPSMVFAVTDAIYRPLAARQVARARESDVQTATNDSVLAVGEAYFRVQQARGELAGSADAVRRAEDLVRRTQSLAEGLAPALEVNRARTELARRRSAVELAHERWQVASADLHRLLRLDPAARAEPVEAPHLRLELIDLKQPVEELISVGLTNRPELASRQALIQATLARLRQEKVRPFLPSVLIRGAAANPGGTLSTGYFGGGLNDDMTNFSARNTFDVQLVWELQNLGFGNRAAVRERAAESRAAEVELLRTQDLVVAEVVQAHAQARRAIGRLAQAEEEVRNARETAEKSLEALSQTRRVGGTILLVARPQEVVASIQALDQAYRGYYGAVADANRAQMRLYRALGHPAQCLIEVQQVPTLAPVPVRAGSAPAAAPPAELPAPRRMAP